MTGERFVSKFSLIHGTEIPTVRDGEPSFLGVPVARTPADHVEIGMRGPRNTRTQVETYRRKGAHLYPAATVRRTGVDALCREALLRAFAGAARTWCHLDRDVLDIGAVHDWGDEPLGLSGLSFAFVAPRAPGVHAVVAYAVVYLMAGWALGGHV